MNRSPIPRSGKQERLDSVAVVLSGTCMLHCFALPVMVTLFPILHGSLLDEKFFHLIMLVFILPTSLIALTLGCRHHKDALTIGLGGLGLTILTLTALFGHTWFGLSGERIVTTIGGIILAASHIQNYRCCRQVNCQHDGATDLPALRDVDGT